MEREFIARIAQQARRLAPTELGLVDDAAWLPDHAAAGTVLTVDLLMDGVHFRLDEVDPRRIGRKALAVNLSDLAAMAALPVAALVAIALPRRNGMALGHAMYEGLIDLASEFSVALAGGDTNSWDGPLVISVTACGRPTPRGLLRRTGARPGDGLLVTGSLGGSLLGHHLDFTPRVREALLLNERYTLSAGMDLSDGLSLDLARLAEASGCGAIVEAGAIPVSPAAYELAARDPSGPSPLQRALGDGEDFELLLAVPPAEAQRMLADQPLGVPLSCVGRCIAEPGIWLLRDGQREPLGPHGFEHILE